MKKVCFLLLSILICVAFYSQAQTGTAGSCWLVSDSDSVDTGDLVQIEIHVNTGTQQLASFGFDLTYYASRLDYIGYRTNSSHSVNYVLEFYGRVCVSSMFVNGSLDGPSADLNVLTLTFMATGAGGVTLDLGVNNLLDITNNQIGTVQEDSIPISISGSETSMPTPATTLVPTPTPYGEETPAPTPDTELEWATEFYIYDTESTGNPPIESALVKVTALTWNSAYTDTKGSCQLEAWADNTGSVNVTVGAAGYLPYSGNIVVPQTENPTVIGLVPDGIDPTPIPTPIDTPPPTATPTSTPAPGLRGDVNDDGSIDIIDALLVAQYYVGLNPQNFNAGNADTNCDDFIDIVDALLIAQYYVGLVTQLCQGSLPEGDIPKVIT